MTQTRNCPLPPMNLPESRRGQQNRRREQSRNEILLGRLACTVIVGELGERRFGRRTIDKAQQAISDGREAKEKSQYISQPITYRVSPVYSCCRVPSEQESPLPTSNISCADHLSIHYTFATMPQQAKAAADDVSPPPKASPEVLNVRKPGYFSRRRILGPVDKEYGDAVLLVHSFVTGLVDAASFANWGVFVGMQTGRYRTCSSMPKQDTTHRSEGKAMLPRSQPMHTTTF
jgi:hypothetical protein